MSYSCINVTDVTVRSAEFYIRTNWIQSEDTNLLKKHVLARGAHLLLIPTSFITVAVDTIIGLGAGMKAIFTLGKDEQTFRVAYKQLTSSNKLFAKPYCHFLLTINPEAKFSGSAANQLFIANQLGLATQATIHADGNGFLSNLMIDEIKKTTRACYNSDNLLKQHVASRLTFALLAVSCLVARAVDGIIGIPAAGLCILTGGKFESLNNLAYRTLQAPGIINDLFYCIIKFINPWTGVR